MDCHPERSEGSAVCGELQIPRFARDDKLCKVSLQLTRQLFVLRSRRLNESAEDRLCRLGQLRRIVYTPLRMPLHRQHKMFGGGSFESFDDSVFGGTRHHAQTIAYSVR